MPSDPPHPTPPDMDPARPVLIAGPTASGKSALAMAIAAEGGGVIVNADALQVHADFRILTARPSAADEAAQAHALYGHVAWGAPWSVGDWLRAVGGIVAGGRRPIIVGGTGLYFRALTEGLASIPPIPADVRQAAQDRLDRVGLIALAADLTADVRAGLDLANPRRVLRAWEVMAATGRTIRDWQADTPPPLLPRAGCDAFLLDAPRDWLSERIERRFHAMIEDGALDEVRTVLPRWDPAAGAAQAIGAPELIAYLRGETDFDAAQDRAVTATRRYAKRQRTWFRARMGDWTPLDAATWRQSR